jgi:hypothetical protein
LGHPGPGIAKRRERLVVPTLRVARGRQGVLKGSANRRVRKEGPHLLDLAALLRREIVSISRPARSFG